MMKSHFFCIKSNCIGPLETRFREYNHIFVDFLKVVEITDVNPYNRNMFIQKGVPR